MTKHEAILQEFSEAVSRLHEVLEQPKNEFIRDSAIKRFEIAFDLSWKAVKALLEAMGLSCASPLGCFREGFRQKFIDAEDQWLELVALRNKSVHTYDEHLAEEMYATLPHALIAFEQLAATLRESVDKL